MFNISIITNSCISLIVIEQRIPLDKRTNIFLCEATQDRATPWRSHWQLLYCWFC